MALPLARSGDRVDFQHYVHPQWHNDVGRVTFVDRTKTPFQYGIRSNGHDYVVSEDNISTPNNRSC